MCLKGFRTNTKTLGHGNLLRSIDLKTRRLEEEARVLPCVIVGFCHGVDNCGLQGYYTASSGNSLPTFRNNLIRCVTTQKSARAQFSRLLPIRQRCSLP